MGNTEAIRFLKGTRQYTTEEESLLLLKYYMVERTIGGYKKYFGIEIVQQEANDHIGDKMQYNSFLLSESREWTEELIDKFIGKGVTPCTMEYIIDDIMGIPC